jgi:hypothetical protein
MGYQTEVQEKYWGWCKKWGIPYPCRKTRTVTRWCYDFSFLNASYSGIYTDYWGCEFNNRYAWRKWEFTGRFEDLALYFVTLCFKNQRELEGECSTTSALVHLRKFLDTDQLQTLQELVEKDAEDQNDYGESETVP